MLADRAGNRMFRKIEVTIHFIDKMFKPKRMVQHAPAHKGYNAEGIDETLMNLADQLDTLYPWWDFEMVTLAPVGRTARYVFKCIGYRAGAVPGAIPTEPGKVFEPVLNQPTDQDAPKEFPQGDAETGVLPVVIDESCEVIHDASAV